MACEKYKKGSSAYKSCMKKEKLKKVAMIGAEKLVGLSGVGLKKEVGKSGGDYPKKSKPKLTFGNRGFITKEIGKGWSIKGSYQKAPKCMGGKRMGVGGGDYDYKIGVSYELGPKKKKK